MRDLVLLAAGLYTVCLGTVHFFLPYLLDFEHAIPREGPSLKPFRLFGFFYGTTRPDIRGIALVMNHTVSFTLVTIGVIDMLSPAWSGGPFAGAVFLWIAAWWALRAFCQFYLGHRRGDWLLFFFFLSLGLFHARCALAP